MRITWSQNYLHVKKLSLLSISMQWSRYGQKYIIGINDHKLHPQDERDVAQANEAHIIVAP
jgi:hypothetical protein